MVDHPIWDLIEPGDYVFPELHAEIGLVDAVLDNFYNFMEGQHLGNRMSRKGMYRHLYIVVDVALALTMQRLSYT